MAKNRVSAKKEKRGNRWVRVPDLWPPTPPSNSPKSLWTARPHFAILPRHGTGAGYGARQPLGEGTPSLASLSHRRGGKDAVDASRLPLLPNTCVAGRALRAGAGEWLRRTAVGGAQPVHGSRPSARSGDTRCANGSSPALLPGRSGSPLSGRSRPGGDPGSFGNPVGGGPAGRYHPDSRRHLQFGSGSGEHGRGQ